MTNDTNPTEGAPHVYKAIHAILGRLSVDKGGVLPGSMGGRPYLTAEDVAKAVRGELYAEELILLPGEEVVESSTTINRERLNYHVLVTGNYRVLSAKDGSEVTVSGTGEGVATGTAVAANIASTFALKNALLRTFLISEQSVEDEGMRDGSAPGPTKAERAAAKAAVTPQPKAKPVANNGEREAQAKIRAEYLNAEEPVLTKEEAGAEIKRLKNAGDKTPYATLLASLEKGELPNG